MTCFKGPQHRIGRASRTTRTLEEAERKEATPASGKEKFSANPSMLILQVKRKPRRSNYHKFQNDELCGNYKQHHMVSVSVCICVLSSALLRIKTYQDCFHRISDCFHHISLDLLGPKLQGPMAQSFTTRPAGSLGQVTCTSWRTFRPSGS